MTYDKAEVLESLHVKGEPLRLFNVWDAGSAKAVVDAGAVAIATSSWAIAEANGYRDGENLPLDSVLEVIASITKAVDVPVTADFEGGYSENDDQLAKNLASLLDLGVVGINFEDRVVSGEGLYDIKRQAGRIATLRAAAERYGVNLFINARTDLFLGQGIPVAQAINEAVERSHTYASAGASGLFVPGLEDEQLMAKICSETDLPVNIMITGGTPSVERLGELGVARISWGALPYIEAMASLSENAKKVLSP